MSPWKVILATMVIFGCGVITGALLMKAEIPATAAAGDVVTPHPSPSGAGSTSTNPPPPWGQVQRPEFLRRLQRALDLTPEQHDAIAKIMKDSQIRSRPLWDQIAPEMRTELRRVKGEIRAVLTPEQQKKYDEMLKNRQRKQPADQPPAQSPAPTNAL